MGTCLLALFVAAAPVRLEPEALSFGPTEERLEVVLPADATSVTVISANGIGAVSAAERVGPGRFAVKFTFPPERFPQLALLAIETQTGTLRERHWVALPLLANATLKLETKPLASVTVAIGALTFGPATADRTGKLELAAKVPPGYPAASVTAVDRARNKTTTPLDLAVRPFPCAAALGPADGASPDAAVEVDVFAVEPTGKPLASGEKVRAFGAKGMLGKLEPRGAGRFGLQYRAPNDVKSGRDDLGVLVEGFPASTAAIALRPGKPTQVAVTFGAPQYTAGGGGKLKVEAYVTDAYGNRAPGRAPQLKASFGTVTADGLELPDAFGGRKQVEVQAEVDGLKGSATLPLQPGPAQSAELVLPGNAEAGLSVEGQLKVRDAWGNPVEGRTDALAVTVNNDVAASIEPAGDGSFKVSVDVPRSQAHQDLDVAVKSDGKALVEREVTVLPYQRPWAVVASVQLAGAWNFSRAYSLSPRVWLGLRLGRTPVELGAEGAFLAYLQQQNAPTSDGIDDAQTDVSAWAVALSARGALPLTSRVSLHAALSVGAQHATQRLVLTDTPVQTFAGWGFVGRGGAGAGVNLPFGKVLAQVEYGIAPAPRASRLQGNLGGLGLALGYVASF
jgi:hypothetical protein